jgi:hypothetical protein
MVGTFRRECLDHLIVLHEQQVRSVLSEFVAYYNRDRPHRSLALRTPEVTRRRQAGRLTGVPFAAPQPGSGSGNPLCRHLGGSAAKSAPAPSSVACIMSTSELLDAGRLFAALRVHRRTRDVR